MRIRSALERVSCHSGAGGSPSGRLVGVALVALRRAAANAYSERSAGSSSFSAQVVNDSC